MKRVGAALAAAALAWPGAPGAQDASPQEAPPTPLAAPSLPERLGEAAGTWDLSRDGMNRRCVMTLSLDNDEAGKRLTFPAGCRRALPVVGPVVGWLFTDGVVRLVDRNVRPVLLFKRRPDQRSLVATAEGGETYSFVPLDIAAMRPPEAQRLEAPTLRSDESPVPLPGPSAVIEAPTQRPPAPPDGSPVSGVYAVDRFQERDTCRLALETAGGAVKVVPGCRDAGIEVFDPTRWRSASGRMTLTAKRGHSIDLVPTGDGRWRRDPEVGTTFVLRRIEP